MQIVIEIPKEEYDAVKGMATDHGVLLYKAIRESIPLPEHHGRLIDADDLSSISVDCDSFGCLKKINAPTIIEASEEAVG